MQHAALIAALILERPLCLDCIAAKAELTVSKVDEYFTVISRALPLRCVKDRCRACGKKVMAFSFSRPMD